MALVYNCLLKKNNLCSFPNIYMINHPSIIWRNKILINRQVSKKSRLITLLLAIFLGIFGAHRFYADRIASGVLYLCTEGLFGIGVIVDIILIATGGFYDGHGLPIINWDETPKPIYRAQPHPFPPQNPQSAYSSQPTEKTQYQSNEPVIYCPECGSINETETVYCSTCGLALNR